MNFLRGKVEGHALYFGQNRLDLSPVLGQRVSEWEGREMVLGYRPEAIQLGARGNGYEVTGGVELTEMLGDYTNIYILAEEDQAILKVDSHDTPEMDIDLTYTIPYSAVYLFDGETEDVIPTDHGKTEA